MNPIKFEEVNVVFGENQPEYIPIPAFKVLNDENCEVVTCWKLTLTERLKLLFSGKLWVSNLTFNKPFSPVYMTVNKTDVLVVVDEDGMEIQKDPIWCRIYEKITGLKIPEYNKADYARSE